MASNRRTRKARRKTVEARRETEFHYRGHTLDELNALPMDELIELLPSRSRRKFKRGLPEEQKRFIEHVQNANGLVRTHYREAVVLPSFVGKEIAIHNGKEFQRITVQPEMIGHLLGEFALTRSSVKHTGPGVGATRSSKYMPLK